MTENTNPNMHHVTLHKPKKAWYKRWWIWLIILIVLISVAASGSKESTKTSSSNPQATKSSAAPTKWDIQAAYDKIQTGMTKSQVEEVTGKSSDNCATSATQGIGTTEICNYGSAFSDKGTITVTYSNDAVFSKTKATY